MPTPVLDPVPSVQGSLSDQVQSAADRVPQLGQLNTHNVAEPYAQARVYNLDSAAMSLGVPPGVAAALMSPPLRSSEDRTGQALDLPRHQASGGQGTPSLPQLPPNGTPQSGALPEFSADERNIALDWQGQWDDSVPFMR